jgi:transposase
LHEELAQRADVVLAFCWSHVRRQFYEIQVKTPAPIATESRADQKLAFFSQRGTS